MTSLRGNLSTVDLANILQMLQMNQREGTLYITGAEDRRAIYFGLDGVSTLSRGGRRHGALGRILVRQGVISDEQLADGIRRQAEGSARLIGQVLVEQGLVKREQIEDALRLQIEEEIYDLFITRDAQFEFVEGDVPEEFADPEGVNRIAVNVNSVIMEAAQRIDEWEWIQSVVPDVGEIYRYTGLNVPLDDDIFHERATGRVLTAIDGRKNIDDLIEESYVERFDVCKVVALLLQANALEPVPPEALREEAEKSIAAGDTAGTIKYMLRLTELHAETPETHRRLAEAYESESELERAAFHYRVFAETRVDCGDSVEAFHVYCRIFEILPTDLAAADRMVEIFAMSPIGIEDRTADVIETGKLLAEVYVDLKRGSRAIQVLHRIVSLAPDDADLRTRLIEIYLGAGMTGEAVAEYEILAETALARDDFTRAERIYRKILTIDTARNDILRRLNQLISRKTRRRRSVRNSIAAAGVVTLLGVAGWYGIRFMLERQADGERVNARASAQVTKIRDRHAQLTSDLEALITRLAGSRADNGSRLGSLQGDREEREALQTRANLAVRDLMKLVDAHAGTPAADEARALAATYNKHLRSIESLEREAVTHLAASAQQLYLDATKLAAKGASTRTQWAKFDEAMSIGAVCADWLASSDGTECQAFHASLREILDSLVDTDEAVEALLQAGDVDAAFDRAVSFLHEYPPPDLADELLVPIRVHSWPPGAAIAMNGEDTGQRTPATISVPVRIGCEFVLTSPDFEPKQLMFEAVTDSDPRDAEKRIPRMLNGNLQRAERFTSERLPGQLEATPGVHDEFLLVPMRGAETAVLSAADGTASKALSLRNPSGAVAAAIVTNGVVSTATIDGRIYFHRLSDRKLLGAYEAPGPLRSDVAQFDGLLIAVTSRGYVVAVDVETRAERWRYPSANAQMPPARVGAPIIADGELFSATADGRITVIDPRTGVRLREVRLRTPDGDVKLVHGIVVDHGAILAVTPGGQLIKADSKTGEQLWNTPLDVHPAGPPLTNGARVIVLGRGGKIVSVRQDDAEAVGEYDTETPITVPGALQGDALYVALAGGRLLAVDVGPSAVRPLWEYVIPTDGGDAIEISTRPLIVGDLAIFGGADTRVRAVAR